MILGESREADVPPDLAHQFEEMRNRLIEQVAELDDQLTLKYLEGDKISVDELKAALRTAVISNQATPVYCGSSLRKKGYNLFDAVIDFCLPMDILWCMDLILHRKKKLKESDDQQPECAGC
jgi:elongation factor G